MAGPASRSLQAESSAGRVTLRYLGLSRHAVQTGTPKVEQPPRHVSGACGGRAPWSCALTAFGERAVSTAVVKAAVSLSLSVASPPHVPSGLVALDGEQGVLRPSSEAGGLAMGSVRAWRGEATWLTVTAVASSIFPMQDQHPGCPPLQCPSPATTTQRGGAAAGANVDMSPRPGAAEGEAGRGEEQA